MLPLLLATSAAMLTACGGGGSGASTTAASGVPATPVVATASSVQLLVSSPQMNSAGTSTIGLTAVVLSATRQVVPGRTVVFSAKVGPASAGSTTLDPTAFINNVSALGVSDANGVVTAQLNLGGSKANRIITVNAVVDGITAKNDVSVVGTTVVFSGNTSMSFGATTTLNLSVKDSAGNGISGASVTLTSQNGNTIALASPTTDANGLITANVTAAVAGNDVLTASVAGASKTQSLSISNAVFGFSAPIPGQINVSTPTSLSVLWTNVGLPVVGSVVTFTASRGTISLSPAITSVSGIATASISSASSGPSIITATGPGGTPSASLTVNFVASTASNVTVQASPSTLQPTTGAIAQTSNISTISAVVRDSSLNLVQNARVNFSITADPSGGGLNASTAVTDASGTASVNYQAGAISSPQNGVTITATAVDIGGVTIAPAIAPSPVSITVGGTALFVRLGTDNTVAPSGTNDTKTYSALVTDSAGNPAPAGTQVRFVLRSSRFFKGFYTLPCVVPTGGGACVPTPPWVQTVAAACGNEDVNFNGFSGAVTVAAAPNPLTGMTVVGGIPIATNDYNGNGRLDPGNVASVNLTATTDASGFALATISYAKSYATWAEVELEARAGVVGNDPPAVVKFVLPGLFADYNATSSPPGQISSFGSAAGCNSAL